MNLEKQPNFPKIAVQVAIVVACLFGILSVAALFKPVALVRAGYRGVVFNKFHGVDTKRNLPEGMHFTIPFVESVVPMSVQVQKSTFTTAAASKDLQQVNTEVVINFHLDPDKAAKLYQEVGEDYISKLIEPSVQESIKAVTADYNATDLIAKRSTVKKEAQDVVTGHCSDLTYYQHFPVTSAESSSNNSDLQAPTTCSKGQQCCEQACCQHQHQAWTFWLAPFLKQHMQLLRFKPNSSVPPLQPPHSLGCQPYKQHMRSKGTFLQATT